MKLNLLSKALVSMFLLSANLHAEQGDDPYIKGDTPNAAKKVEVAYRNIPSTFELFSISTKEAATMMRSNLDDQSAYDLLKEKGKLEAITVTCSQNGEMSRVVSAKEIIYPTNYEPAKVLHKPDSKSTKDNAVIIPAIGIDFEVRCDGLRVTTEIVVCENRQYCDVKIDAELCSYVGERKNGQGISMTSMPIFESQSLKQRAFCTVEKPQLLGTMSRTASSEKGEGFSEKVWFAFITVNLVE